MNKVSVTTENVRIRNWDERVIAIISSNPIAEDNAHIECACGVTLKLDHMLDDYCKTQGCTGKAKAFRGTEFTRQFAANINETAKSATWFHATLDPNWEETLTALNLPPVHLGVKEASEELGMANGEGYGYFLYEVKLASYAIIAPYVCPDKRMHWAETTSQLKQVINADFIGYLNLWESVGNISLLGNGQRIEVVSRKWVPLTGNRETGIENVRGRLEWARASNLATGHAYFVPQMEALLSTLTQMTEEEFMGEKQLQLA